MVIGLRQSRNELLAGYHKGEVQTKLPAIAGERMTEVEANQAPKNRGADAETNQGLGAKELARAGRLPGIEKDHRAQSPVVRKCEIGLHRPHGLPPRRAIVISPNASEASRAEKSLGNGSV